MGTALGSEFSEVIFKSISVLLFLLVVLVLHPLSNPGGAAALFRNHPDPPCKLPLHISVFGAFIKLINSLAKGLGLCYVTAANLGALVAQLDFDF